MGKVVITGVDGSDSATRAAATAAELAAAYGGSLIVLSAFEGIEVAAPSELSDVVPMSAADVAESVAQEIVDGLRSDHPELDMTARAVVGKPADALVGTAGDVGASVIVVGNKRVQGLARILGSIAQDVVQRASCDVYIAHTHQR